MKSALLALALLAAATSAAALSCRPADPTNAFAEANAATAQYIIVRGRFSFDKTALPGMRPGSDLATPGPAPAPVAARFRGQMLQSEGFAPIAPLDIVLLPDCAGPWCGQLSHNHEVVAFLRGTAESGWVLDLPACNQWVFSPDSAAQLHRCLARGACDTP